MSDRDGKAGLGDYALLATLALLAVIPLLAMLRHAEAADLVFTGVDGPFAADQFQYLSWVREYEDHLLASNILDVGRSDHVFFHPMFFVSGIAARLGLSVELAFMLWKPVAIVALFLGFRAYVRRFVEGRGTQLATLALALFFASPLAALVDWASLGGADFRADMAAGAGEAAVFGLQWGYLPTVIAVALMPVFLLGVERIASSHRPPPATLAWVSAAGALASWLHPWQGEVLIVIVGGAVALARFPRRLWILAVPLAATAAPLLYYFALSRLDPDWELAQLVNESLGQVSLWPALVMLLPLLAPAALGVRTVGRSLGEVMLLLWTPAALLVLVALSPSFPQHALEGISLPLAVLAARGLGMVPRPGLALAATVAVLTVPGALWLLDFMRDSVGAGGQAHYLEPGESDALRLLEEADEPGPVLTDAYLGPLVPAKTGRATFVGHPSWTRDFDERARQTTALLEGRLSRRQAALLLERSGARFVIAGCGSAATAAAAIRPFADQSAEVGCAAVYHLAPGRLAARR